MYVCESEISISIYVSWREHFAHNTFARVQCKETDSDRMRCTTAYLASYSNVYTLSDSGNDMAIAACCRSRGFRARCPGTV
jgi:hypothetical protein